MSRVMVRKSATLVALALLFAAEARAEVPEVRSAVGDAALSGDDDAGPDDGMPYLQCVPYARQVSGIRIYGDAWTWWDQAEGRYAKGYRPKVGAVMSFRPYGNMRLGHVAAVSRVIDSRTVLLRHANWSPIDGRRGQIEDDVRAIDVSPQNDWSEVRVWFAPIGGLGTTHWPLNGFIYPEKAKPGMTLASRTTVTAAPQRTPTVALGAVRQPAAATPSRTLAAAPSPASSAPSRIGANFLAGIRPEVPVRGRQVAAAPARTPAPAAAPARRPAPARATTTVRSDDPIGRIIASRSR